jgi:hypothetical protein
MQDRRAVINNVYRIRRDIAELLVEKCEFMLRRQDYRWGACLAMLNYVFTPDTPSNIGSVTKPFTA